MLVSVNKGPCNGISMGKTKSSSVDEASILRQAVLNTSTSLEILREAVSNSVDADATMIDIILAHVNGDMWNIIIEDDGHGMEESHMDAFFQAGVSVKDNPKAKKLTIKKQIVIGEKGLGSKTTWVAKEVRVESIRKSTNQLITGVMKDPLSQLNSGKIPDWDFEDNPAAAGYTPKLTSGGTRIELDDVRLASFAEKKTDDIIEIANRVMHYLRSYCATGTVKTRHSSKQHIKQNIFNVGSVPDITLEVTRSGKSPVTLGPVSGEYNLPSKQIAPSSGPKELGVEKKSENYCDLYDGTGSKTITISPGVTKTINYDVTCVVAGNIVKENMIEFEKRSGVGQKSLMGLHFCKDFIPLKTDAKSSKEFLDSEYYYDFKIFLNCQHFTLNADRNVITNLDSDEVSWIKEDFKKNMWPSISIMHDALNKMRSNEDSDIEAKKKSNEAVKMLNDYKTASNLVVSKSGAKLNYLKSPKKEADVTHIIAAMMQSGKYTKEFGKLEKFGQFIDGTTDAIFEDSSGKAMLIEIEYKLANLYKHKHPFDTFDGVIVWTISGASNGHTWKSPWGKAGGAANLQLIGSKGKWEIKWGTKKKKLWVLEEFI